MCQNFIKTVFYKMNDYFYIHRLMCISKYCPFFTLCILTAFKAVAVTYIKRNNSFINFF